MHLIPKIRERRMEKHMTQGDLAKRIKINQAQLSRYETGKHIPDIPRLMDLEEALDCKLKDLYKRID